MRRTVFFVESALVFLHRTFAEDHLLQFATLLLLALPTQLAGRLLVGQHVFNVFAHLFNVGNVLLFFAFAFVSRQDFVGGQDAVLKVKDPLALFLVALLMLGDGESIAARKLVHPFFAGLGLFGGQRPDDVDNFPSGKFLDLLFGHSVFAQDRFGVVERQAAQIGVGARHDAFRLRFQLFLVDGRLVGHADVGESFAASGRICRPRQLE